MKPLSERIAAMEAQAAKPAGSVHSRFIPREEIDGVAAWQFDAVDGSQPAAGADSGPAISEDALHDIRQQAYAEGFAHGHDAGSQEVRDALEAPLRHQAEEAGVRLAQLLQSTRNSLIRSEQQISQHILELACDLARQVVRRELRADHEALKPVIAEALRELVIDGLPATVRLNPADLQAMGGALRETLASPVPELVADPAISPGGCVVETAATSVDATVEKRWARAVGNLGMNVPWDPENADV